MNPKVAYILELFVRNNIKPLTKLFSDGRDRMCAIGCLNRFGDPEILSDMESLGVVHGWDDLPAEQCQDIMMGKNLKDPETIAEYFRGQEIGRQVHMLVTIYWDTKALRPLPGQ